MKIAVTTILGDQEERHVDRWLKTTALADARVIVDCSTKGHAAKLLRLAGVHVHKFKGPLFRFDHARNQGLQAVPVECETVITCDMDETFSPAWYDAIQATMDGKKNRRLSYRFIQSWTKDGKADQVFLRDACHSRWGYRFIHPCHEQLVSDHAVDLVYVDGFHQEHHQDGRKARGNYLPLLYLSAEESPKNSHVRFNLIRQLFFSGMYDDALKQCAEYEALDGKIHYQHSTILRYMAEINGAIDKRLGLLGRACQISPALREPWVDYADALIDNGDLGTAVVMLETALQLKEKPPLSVCGQKYWSGDYVEKLLEFSRSKMQE